MTSSINEITGDKIKTKVNSNNKLYEDNWERIFRKEGGSKVTKDSTKWIVRDLFEKAWEEDTHCDECQYLMSYVEDEITFYDCECREPENCLYVIYEMERLEK